MKRYYFLLMALLLLAACTKSETDSAAVQQLHNSPDFYASFEAEDTRTFVDEKVRLLWTEGDQLSIFTTTLNQKYEFDGETGDNSGTFTPISSGQFGSGSSLSVDANFAVYPYNQSTKISYDGDLSIDLPSTQAYAEDSFGVNANTMVAATKSQNDYFLSFKNLGGFLKLQLYGDVTVKSIQLEGNNGEKIAGAATVVAKSGKNPTLTMSSTATDVITLDCGAGVKLGTSAGSATEFWLVVPPVTFSKGFTITITDTEGGTMTKSTTKSYTVERNVMKSMTAFEVETEQPVQILYTSTDGSVITPNTTAFGGAKIVSNVYENGQGVITFDKKITSLPAEAFQSKTKLVTISLPESVTSIGNYAFENCSRLTTITASGVTSVGKNSFYNCAKLEDIPFPNLKTIDDYAFQKCIGLTNVDLPNATTINSYAFDGCTSLKTIKLAKLAGVLGAYAFRNCSSLESIDLSNEISSIEQYAFYGCNSIDSVYITDIEAWLNIDFKGNYGYSNPMRYGAKLYLNSNLVENVIIPEGLKIIKPYTFYGCVSLKRITIPNSVTTIGAAAFSGCISLKSVFVSDMISWCAIDISSNPMSNGAKLYLNNTLLENLIIPEDIATIKSHTFDGCTSLRSVTISNGVTSIGAAAFVNCTSLETVNISNSVTTIGSSAFQGCSSLLNITLPEKVDSIGLALFMGCNSLQSVTFGDNVTLIGSYAFSDCTSLTNIVISNGVITIESCAFEGCTSLMHITIPDSVTAIKDDAFLGCIALTDVIIGNSVKMIGDNVFDDCESLSEVYCKPITPPSLGWSAFGFISPVVSKIYVPTESIDAYKTASDWSHYKNKVIGYNFE